MISKLQFVAPAYEQKLNGKSKLSDSEATTMNKMKGKSLNAN